MYSLSYSSLTRIKNVHAATHMTGSSAYRHVNNKIIPKAQYLADQLTGGFGDEAAPEVRISGEDLILVINSSLRRQGFGRLAIGDFS